MEVVVTGSMIASISFVFLIFLTMIADARGWFYKLSKNNRVLLDLVNKMEMNLSMLEKNTGNSDHETTGDYSEIFYEYKIFICEYKTLFDIFDQNNKEKSIKIKVKSNKPKKIMSNSNSIPINLSISSSRWISSKLNKQHSRNFYKEGIKTSKVRPNFDHDSKMSEFVELERKKSITTMNTMDVIHNNTAW